MIGIAFHSPNLVSLMVDRERFVAVVVPHDFDSGTQDELEELFAKKAPPRTRRLLLVDKAATLSKLGTYFPDAKCRIVVFDAAENLSPVVSMIPDMQESDGVKKLVALKPLSLNKALVRLKPTALEDYRGRFEGEAVEIAVRDGKLADAVEGASDSFKRTAVKYLLGLTSFATLKRSGRQDRPRVLQVQQYAEADSGVNLMYAFMDMSLYGTEAKEAALFSKADLEDLRFIAEVIDPATDLAFKNEVPDKLALARE